MTTEKTFRIGIVVGEVSGDYLASELIKKIKQRLPNTQFEGIAGPKMLELGCHSFYSMDRLAVMGLFEVLGRLFELLKIRKALVKHWTQSPPDLFIGVDAPAFNIGLAQLLKQHGIKTVQYVGPTVWAWRASRIFRIKKAVDTVLTLFPFETDIYTRHGIKVVFVGHPLADEIPLQLDSAVVRGHFN